jgi:acyl carrier protein
MTTKRSNDSEPDINLFGAMIRDFIITHIVGDPSAKLDLNTPLRETGLIDSLGLLDLLTFIETTFDLRLPDYFGDTPDCRSVATIACYVHSETTKHNG